jgi:endonuclease/exonuclease/phosphatase family metal-dependent hydrolase
MYKLLSPLFTVALIVIIIAGSAMAQKPKSLTVAFYNVENLFDTLDNPAINDEDFLPQGKLNWNKMRYDIKLNRIAKVVNAIEELNKPDIVGLCEVENKAVLTDLVSLKSMDKFDIIHFDSPDERGIDVALLYRKKVAKVLNAKPYRVNFPNDPNDRTRDILLASLKIGKDTLHTLVCHLPSRRGGADKSAESRLTAALVARHIVDSIQKINPLAKIIVMGDMNDEPTDASLLDGLQAKSTPEEAKNGKLFNPMAALKTAGEGSYMYNKKYDMIDNMIVSEGLLAGKGLLYSDKSAAIFKPEWLQEQNEKYKGSPWRTYAGSKYLGGYSDHFPVYLKLKLN